MYSSHHFLDKGAEFFEGFVDIGGPLHAVAEADAVLVALCEGEHAAGGDAYFVLHGLVV